MKLFIGIAFLSVPKGVSQVGIYGAIIGLLWILAANCYTTWLLIKARNKFKREEVKNLSDLAYKLYGTDLARRLTDFIILAT